MKTFLLSLIIAAFCITAKAQTITPTHLPAAITCGCSSTGWTPITAYIGPTKSTVNCGYQFNVKKAQYVKLVGTYTCSGSCAPKYIVILKKADGTILQNTSMTTFAWGYTFPDYGGYRLEVTPICNGNKCATCTFYFTMNP